MSAKPLPVDTGPPPGDPALGTAPGSIAGAGDPTSNQDHASTPSDDTPNESPSTASSPLQGEDAAFETMSATTSDAAPSPQLAALAAPTAHGEAQSSLSSANQTTSQLSVDQDVAGSAENPESNSDPATAAGSPLAPANQVNRGFSVGVASKAPAGRQSSHARRQEGGHGSGTRHAARGRSERTDQSIGGPRPKQTPPTAWTTSGAAALRSSFRGPAATLAAAANSTSQQQVWRGDPALLQHFKKATAPTNLRDDGDQRAMTAFEEDVLYQWHAHKLHLAHPPSFIYETHTSAEQDVFNDFHLDHCGFNLYGRLPAGAKISESNAKFEFVHAAILACGSNATLRSQVVEMGKAAHTIHCLPASHVVVVRFIYPDERQKWADFTFPFGKSNITLRATDSLTTDVPRVGVDASARELLHHVFLHGDWQRLRHQQIRAIGAKAAGMPVFAVELVDSIGLSGYSGPKWKLTFKQITCPEALEQVRRIKVSYDGYDYVYEVHHPRVSHRLPCTKCLSVRHATRDCKNVHAATSLAKYTCILEMDKVETAPKLTAALSFKKARKQREALRQKVAPGVAARLKEEETSRARKAEQKVKAEKDRLAKQAAAEARAADEIKKQHQADLMRKERHKEGLRRQSVTKQLLQIVALQTETQTSTNPATVPVSTVKTKIKQFETTIERSPGKAQAVSRPQQGAVGKERTSTALTIYTPSLPLIGKRAAPPSPSGSNSSCEELHARKWTREDDQQIENVGRNDATNAKAPAEGTVRAAGPTVLGEKKGPRQLPLSAFFAPQPLADAQAQFEQEVTLRQLKPAAHWTVKYPSPQLDTLLVALRAPRTLTAWEEALGARIINTPTNGGCFHFAAHGCRYRHLWGRNMKICRTHVNEGNYYKRAILNSLLEYLDAMLADGTVTLAGLTRRFFTNNQPVNEAAALKAARVHIGDIRDRDIAHGLTRSQWGGDEEIFGFVWYIREPVFVISEAADGSTAVCVVRIHRDEAHGPERLVEFILDADEAYETLRTFLRHRAMPTILVHCLLGEDGHWNTFRFNEQMYTDWTVDDQEGLAMRARVDQALAALGWYVPPHVNAGIPKFAQTPAALSQPDGDASGSLYEPSFSLLSSAEPSELETCVQPAELYALLSSLNPRRRRRGPQAALWERAERANLIAYREWEALQEAGTKGRR